MNTVGKCRITVIVCPIFLIVEPDVLVGECERLCSGFLGGELVIEITTIFFYNIADNLVRWKIMGGV